MIPDLPELSRRAARLGRYPRRSAASNTRRAVAGLTEDLPRSALDAVILDTPASPATSSKVVTIAVASLAPDSSAHSIAGQTGTSGEGNTGCGTIFARFVFSEAVNRSTVLARSPKQA